MSESQPSQPTPQSHNRANIYIPADIKARIDALKSSDIHVNVSSICVRALRDWLDENEEKVKSMNLTAILKG